MKPAGWKYDSVRHALAAKGIRTYLSARNGGISSQRNSRILLYNAERKVTPALVEDLKQRSVVFEKLAEKKNIYNRSLEDMKLAWDQAVDDGNMGASERISQEMERVKKAKQYIEEIENNVMEREHNPNDEFDAKKDVEEIRTFGESDVLPEKQVAMERFDPERLVRIKGGGHRAVFLLDDKDKVLKVAKTPLGLQQNMWEMEPVGAKGLYSGKDFVVVERASPAKDWYNNMLKARYGQLQDDKTLRGISGQDAYLYAALQDLGLQEYTDYNLSRDALRPSSWGIRRGEPVLVDKGSLSVRDLTRVHEDTKKDWRAVLHQRKMAKGVGHTRLFAKRERLK